MDYTCNLAEDTTANQYVAVVVTRMEEILYWCCLHLSAFDVAVSVLCSTACRTINDEMPMTL